jgi:hypothetical protein
MPCESPWFFMDLIEYKKMQKNNAATVTPVTAIFNKLFAFSTMSKSVPAIIATCFYLSS